MNRTILGLGLISVMAFCAAAAHAAVLAANKTEIMFDGEKIHGLKGFTYKVYKDRRDVRGDGKKEGTGLLQKRLHVIGEILVHSSSELLDKHMDNNTSLQIILQTIMQDSYPEGLSGPTFRFHECAIEGMRPLSRGDGARAFTVYSFRAAGVSGAFPTKEGKMTPGYLRSEWEFDEEGYSWETAAMVAEGAELTDMKVDDWTFQEALEFQLDGHGYALTGDIVTPHEPL
ncbi:MAG: hypothetical protein ABII00_07775 [Elusimicrobiota bacterium]